MSVFRPIVAIASQHAHDRKAVINQLGKSSYQLRLVSSASEILELVRQEPLDVVILEYFLPDMNAPLSIEKIKDIDPRIRIIVMTDKVSDAVERAARGQGISFFAIKPNDFKYLRDAVRTAILSRQRQQFIVNQQQKVA